VGIFVAPTIIGQTWVKRVAFWTCETGLTFTGVTDAIFTGNTICVIVTGVSDGAPVNWVTAIVAITSEVVATNAVVSFWLVDALGICVTGVVASFTFIDGTDDGIVISGEPKSPLGSVRGSTLSVHVVG
jgi:dolichol kinase